METLRLGTRGSELALFQANAVAALLSARSSLRCEIVVIKTSGDRLAEASLAQIGGKRLFVKEIEDALLAGDVDLAVHSSKDMPALLPPGLRIGAVLPREDPLDAIVLPAPAAALSLREVEGTLGRAPRIGTSSIRRVAQLARRFPRRVVSSGARKPRDEASQARHWRVRCPRAGRRRAAPAGTGRPDHRHRSG